MPKTPKSRKLPEFCPFFVKKIALFVLILVGADLTFPDRLKVGGLDPPLTLPPCRSTRIQLNCPFFALFCPFLPFFGPFWTFSGTLKNTTKIQLTFRNLKKCHFLDFSHFYTFLNFLLLPAFLLNLPLLMQTF